MYNNSFLTPHIGKLEYQIVDHWVETKIGIMIFSSFYNTN